MALVPIVLMFGIWASGESSLVVGQVFTPLFPEPQVQQTRILLPPRPTAPTPEQKAETRAVLEKRETRLRVLIRGTQSKT